VGSLEHSGRIVIDIYQAIDFEWRMVKYVIRVWRAANPQALMGR
jgi:hypothetical protein